MRFTCVTCVLYLSVLADEDEHPQDWEDYDKYSPQFIFIVGYNEIEGPEDWEAEIDDRYGGGWGW